MSRLLIRPQTNAVRHSLRLVWSLCFCLLMSLSVFADIEQDLQQAESWVRQGKYTEALTLLDSVLAQNPERAYIQRATSWKGSAYMGLLQYDNAIALFEQLVSQNAAYLWPRTLNKLAVAYHAKHDTAKLNHYFQLLLTRRQTTTDAADKLLADLMIGDLYKLVGHWGSAVTHYQNLLSLYPEQEAEILFHLGNSAHGAQQFVTSLQAYQDYTRLYPSAPRFKEVALYKLNEVYRDAGRPQEALTYLDDLLSDHPDWKDPILLWKAELYSESLGDVPTSMQLAQQVIDESSDAYQRYLAKRRQAYNLQHSLKQPVEARAILETIVNLYPTDHLAIELANDIAFSYYQERNYERAAQAYAAALANYPCPVPQWDASIRCIMADALRRSGNPTQAKALLEEVMTKHKGNEWAAFAKRSLSRWFGRRTR